VDQVPTSESDLRVKMFGHFVHFMCGMPVAALMGLHVEHCVLHVHHTEIFSVKISALSHSWKILASL
jgi:hypothetical protein